MSRYLEDDHLANLRENSPQQGKDDGGLSKEPFQKPQDSQWGLSSSSKVKDRALALLDQLSVSPRLRSLHKLDFVYLLEGDPDGIISYMSSFQPSLRYYLHNKSSCKSFGVHLVDQPRQNPKLHIPGYNLADGKIWV